MSNNPLFVAEIDVNGSVDWVWYRCCNGDPMRPLKPNIELRDNCRNIAFAEYSGATESDIHAWLSKNGIVFTQAVQVA
jgi:hypothetical protein